MPIRPHDEALLRQTFAVAENDQAISIRQTDTSREVSKVPFTTYG